MVLRRERSGGGRVFAGGRAMLFAVGEGSGLMVDCGSFVDFSAPESACSFFSGPSFFVSPASPWRSGPSTGGSSVSDGSCLAGTCSTFSEGLGRGIDGIGKSL